MRAQLHLYTAPVVTLTQENNIYDALSLMQKNDIKHIVIVRGNFPIGIITERDIGRFLDKDKTTRSLDKIYVGEIMSRNLITIMIDQNDHLNQCAVRMETFQIGSVIVVSEDGKLIGITTKSDLVNNFSNIYIGTYKVNDYMTRKVVTCRKSDSLPYVLNMLNRNKIARIVVTDKIGKPIGIVTYDTFLRNSEFFKTGKQIVREYLLPKSTATELQIGDLMGNELLTIEAEEDLAKAAKLMNQYKVSGIPVVDKDGNLEGIISSSDIAHAYSEVEIHSRLIKKDPHFV